MDLEAVMQHASTLEHQAADEIFGIITALTGLIPQLLDAWKGEDAQSFEQEWQMHRRDLMALHSDVTALISSLHRSITEQEQASQ